MSGPLGILPGMTYDPTTNRYYSTPKISNQTEHSGSGSSASSSLYPITRCVEDLERPGKKLRMVNDPDDEMPIAGPSRRVMRGLNSWMIKPSARQTRASHHDEISRDRYGAMGLHSTINCGACHGEVVTSLKSYTDGRLYATTDHGRVLFRRKDKTTHFINVCSLKLAGLHVDLARMSTMAIAAGPEAHIHLFHRDPEQLLHIGHEEIDITQSDVFTTSSYDDSCVLGVERGMTTVEYANKTSTTYRRLKSDVLALDHVDRNLIFVGLRNSSVLLEDLRINPRVHSAIANTKKGKAVMNVKKIRDDVVPWGVAVSGLADELLIFDARYGKQPLHNLKGHVNNYHTKLAMAMTPDHSYIFHGESDRRIRAWNTRTGERLQPLYLEPEEDEILSPFRSSSPLRQPTKRRHQANDVVDTPGPGGDMSRILDVDDSDYDSDSVITDYGTSHDHDQSSDEESDESDDRSAYADELTRRLLNRNTTNRITARAAARRSATSSIASPAPRTQHRIQNQRRSSPPAVIRRRSVGTPPGGVIGRIASDEDNPLRKVFSRRVEAMSFSQSGWHLDVAVGGEIQRYGFGSREDGHDDRHREDDMDDEDR